MEAFLKAQNTILDPDSNWADVMAAVNAVKMFGNLKMTRIIEHMLMERPQSVPNNARKSEEEEGEPLEKSFNGNDFIRQLGALGWTEDRRTSEVYFRHPTVTKGSYPIIGRPQELSISMSHMHTVPTNKVKLVLKDGGLMLENGEIKPDPKHRFAPLYRESGHLPPDPTAPKTWDAGAEGTTQIPLDKLVPTTDVPEGDWRVAKHKKTLTSGGKAPHISAMDGGDGTYLISSGDEVYHAAKAAGMTHAPVRIHD